MTLDRTDRDGVRYCASCERDVYNYALTVGEARGYAKDGHCIALDVTRARWHGDLTEPFGTALCEPCKMDVGDTRRVCPHCGYGRHRLVGDLSPG